MEERREIPAGIKFEPVEETHLIKGGAGRKEAGLTVKRTGYTKTNTELRDNFMALLEMAPATVNREKFRIAAGVNKDLGAIGLYIASWETKGAVPVRVSANAIVFHMGAIFRKYPTLRPNTTVACEATVTKDADGRDCIAFNILAALPKARRRRKSSAGGDRSGEPAVAKSEATAS